MSTRGAFGFIKNNKEKIAYNHFDSYPKCLGKEIVNFVMDNSIEELNRICDNISVVESDDLPTMWQIKSIEKFLSDDLKVKDIQDFYKLISEFQSIEYFEKGFPFMLDYKEFMGDSLFCEYAYIINLDNNTLEVYEGGNTEDTGNRFSKYAKGNENYKEVKLRGKIKLKELQQMRFGMYKD